MIVGFPSNDDGLPRDALCAHLGEALPDNGGSAQIQHDPGNTGDKFAVQLFFASQIVVFHILHTVGAQIPCLNIGLIAADMNVGRIGEHFANFRQKCPDCVHSLRFAGANKTVGIDNLTTFCNQDGFILIFNAVCKHFGILQIQLLAVTGCLKLRNQNHAPQLGIFAKCGNVLETIVSLAGKLRKCLRWQRIKLIVNKMQMQVAHL